MKPISLSLFIPLIIFAGFSGADFPVIEPYLLYVTPTSIQIHWEAATGPSVVRYGKDETLQSEKSTSGTSRKQQVTLDGLDADTRYYYRVENGSWRFGPHMFRTAPDYPKPFTFCVYGDNRIKDTSFQYPHPHGPVIQGIAADRPAFFINTGDIFKTGVDTALYMEDFFLGAKDLIANTPFFLAIGNHEYGGDPAARTTKKYFSFPGNKTWYEVNYGGIQFLFLDSTILLRRCAENSLQDKTENKLATDEQFIWLVGKLHLPKPDWRIVVLHHQIYSSGIFGIDSSLVEILVPLFEQNQVDLILSGHEHNYERSERNGITYILTGGGGSYLRPVNIKNNPSQKSAVAEFHHVRVTVNQNRLSGSAICDVDRSGIPDYSDEYRLATPAFKPGDVIDEFEIDSGN